VIQGFGAVGYWASHFFQKDGAKVVAVVEYNSAIYNPNGLDVEAVKQYMQKHGSLAGFPHATEETTMDPASFMEKECDILIPCAMEKAINKDNVHHLNTKLVVEGANGPTTFIAEQELEKQGVIVVPDMLANGGGVTVSYFEWLKNLDHVAPGKLTKKYQEKQNLKLLSSLGYSFPKRSPHMKNLEGAKEIDIVYSGLEEIMTSATRDSWKYAQEHNLSFRDACLGRAIKKIHSHFEQCGLMIWVKISWKDLFVFNDFNRKSKHLL